MIFPGLYNAKATLVKEHLWHYSAQSCRGIRECLFFPRVLVRKLMSWGDWRSNSLITMLWSSILATTPREPPSYDDNRCTANAIIDRMRRAAVRIPFVLMTLNSLLAWQFLSLSLSLSLSLGVVGAFVEWISTWHFQNAPKVHAWTKRIQAVV